MCLSYAYYYPRPASGNYLESCQSVPSERSFDDFYFTLRRLVVILLYQLRAYQGATIFGGEGNITYVTCYLCTICAVPLIITERGSLWIRH